MLLTLYRTFSQLQMLYSFVGINTFLLLVLEQNVNMKSGPFSAPLATKSSKGRSLKVSSTCIFMEKILEADVLVRIDRLMRVWSWVRTRFSRESASV